MGNAQISTIIWFVVLIAVFYFLLIRPQQQRAKKHQKLVSELKVDDRVVTTGGIHGRIKSLRDKKVSLEVSKGVRIIVSKGSIGTKESEEEE